MNTRPHVGILLRQWRQRRRLSQLDLACLADTSSRHVSFLETGRAKPSRTMLLNLAERLDVPLRERNTLLVAAGLAPSYTEHRLDDPAMREARAAIDLVLTGHEPYPALAVDRQWHLVAANRMMAPMLAHASPALLAPPVNVLRLSLHPDGVANRIVNWHEWRAHVLHRLRHQADAAADPSLDALYRELADYPAPPDAAPADAKSLPQSASVVVPLRLTSELGELSLIGTTTVFGMPMDVTLAEIAIESFFPADAGTAQRLRELAARHGIG
ncbi:MAG TPA: helix-turn-helix domain-containing protein [Tahibacter sp.]|nr:helix-turn-helix domain-containing protein [Tahibacter sp.]